MDPQVADLIAHLGLQPHPEGGHYRETFRSPERVSTQRGDRAASTAIWFLLPAGARSRWHRVLADEVWHHYDGGSLELLVLTEDGALARHRLGRDWAAGETPQAVVPAGAWQAARPVDRWALCGCTVAPGFDFADFEMADGSELAARFPEHAATLTDGW